MISVGSNISSTGGLLERLRKELHTSGNACLITLDSGDTSNIKNALKMIIKAAITSMEDIDQYRDYLTSKMVITTLILCFVSTKSSIGAEAITIRPRLAVVLC